MTKTRKILIAVLGVLCAAALIVGFRLLGETAHADEIEDCPTVIDDIVLLEETFANDEENGEGNENPSYDDWESDTYGPEPPDNLVCVYCGETMECYTQGATCGVTGFNFIWCPTESCPNHTGYFDSITPALEHNYIDEVMMEATCQREGMSYHWCTNCHDLAYQETLPQSEVHSFSDTATRQDDDPCDCTVTLYEYYPCIWCGYEDARVYRQGKSGHDTSATVIVPATCTQNGSISWTCQNEGCNKSYSEQIIAVGHIADHDVIVEATEEHIGFTYSVCSVCGEPFNARGIHEWGGYSAYLKTVAATCTTPSYSYYVYIDEYGDEVPLDENYTILGAALGHMYDIIYEQTADCTNDGYKEYECARCGDTYRDDWVSATGHNYKLSTPHGDGLYITYTYTCSVCGDDATDAVQVYVYRSDGTLATEWYMADTGKLYYASLPDDTYTFEYVVDGKMAYPSIEYPYYTGDSSSDNDSPDDKEVVEYSLSAFSENNAYVFSCMMTIGGDYTSAQDVTGECSLMIYDTNGHSCNMQMPSDGYIDLELYGMTGDVTICVILPDNTTEYFYMAMSDNSDAPDDNDEDNDDDNEEKEGEAGGATDEGGSTESSGDNDDDNDEYDDDETPDPTPASPQDGDTTSNVEDESSNAGAIAMVVIVIVLIVAVIVFLIVWTRMGKKKKAQKENKENNDEDGDEQDSEPVDIDEEDSEEEDY